MKKFLIACVAGGVLWIITGVLLMFLQNSDLFSIVIGLSTGTGFGLNTYFGDWKFKKEIFFIDVIVVALFLFTLFNLVKITSGRVALTCMILILSFLFFQKGINDWRMKCK